jgi:hypothetical protein
MVLNLFKGAGTGVAMNITDRKNLRVFMASEAWVRYLLPAPMLRQAATGVITQFITHFNWIKQDFAMG